METLQISTVAGIIAITYLVGMAAKAVPAVGNQAIPIIVGVVGGVLGVVGMHVIPGFPADNVIDAISVGIASGLASTGINQIYKQLSAKGDK